MKSLFKRFTIGLFVSAIILAILVTSVGALGNPVKISNSSNATVFPQTVADGNGYLHTVWMEVANDTSSWTGQNPGILYSRWNGDTWSAPLKISVNTGFAEIPGIASDSNNTVHVVWDDETYGSGISKVAYKTRTSGGTWSSIETLPTPTGTGFNWNSRIATGSSNVPHVVFSGIKTDLTSSNLYWSQKVSGAWTTPEIVSKDTSNNIQACEWSDLRGDNGGNIHVIYWCPTSGPFAGGIFYRKYTGTWSTPILISAAPDIEYTRMAVTPGGEIFVTWFQNINSTVHVRWTVSGAWQTETTLASAGDRSFWGFPIMGVTTDSKERAHVGWGEKGAGGLIDVRFKSYDPGTNSWGSVKDVDLNNNDADSPFVYPDKWDNQHFAWTEKNPSSNQWEIMYRVVEGTIQTVGPSGATITANPGNTTYLTLDIPVNALLANTDIGIQIGPVPESVNPAQLTIPRAFTFRPHGLVFSNNKQATANIFYTDPEVLGVDERQLKAWLWDSSTNTWQAKSTRNTPSQNKIAVDLTRFSLYGISAPIVNVSFSSPVSSETIKEGAKLVEFTMNYADGTETVPPASKDELMIKVKKGSEVVKTILFEPSGIQKDGKNRYKTELFFAKDKYTNGDYTLEVYLAENLVGSQNFTLERK